MSMSLATTPVRGIWDSRELFYATGRSTCCVVVRWTKLGGEYNKISEIGFIEDMEAIKTRVWKLAREEGWKPRKWWHWWRFDDTPNPPPPASAKGGERG